MTAKLMRAAKRLLLILLGVALTLLGVRAYNASQFPSLRAWHTFVPEELTIAQLDAADWTRYLQAEEAIFRSVREQVSGRLEEEDRSPVNRYFEGSPVYPGRFADDWNRSYLLVPEGTPKGAVVFLHGLTDSPYSLRHLARLYRDHGFVAVAPRLPAHGTVPAGLTRVKWEDWTAATRLAVREARRRAGPHAPLHLVGFSNGGALAMKHALDALEDKSLAAPDQIVLISPMIGITRFARLSGFAGLPALLPPFAKASWLSVVPEFNPFKYNSFPVNGGRQSWRLTSALQEQIVRLSRTGALADLPPILTFQSVLDFTVSTPAILSALYAHLPENGSEIVLFDVNRFVKFGPMLRASAGTAVQRLTPAAPVPFRFTVIANESPETTRTVERAIDPGTSAESVRKLDLEYPQQIFSLSHVAVPFPLDDPLYGLTPDPATREQYGVAFGTMAVRGERNALIVDQDFLTRISSNPFFPYMVARIEESLAKAPQKRRPPAAGARPPSAVEAPLPAMPVEPLYQRPAGP